MAAEPESPPATTSATETEQLSATPHATDAGGRELSRSLQQALLPRNAPTLAGYDVAAGSTAPSEAHGCSIWDWFTLPDGRVALLTLNVSPGAFPAAHSLALVRAFLRELSGEGKDAASLLGRVNAAISRTAVSGMESPADCALIALGGAEVSWLGAGGVHGGVLRRDGTMEPFPSGGPPLGLMDGFRYAPVGVSLRTGDVIFALSHGARGLFKGAADVVAELHGKPAGEIVTRLQAALGKAAGENATTEHSVLFVRKS